MINAFFQNLLNRTAEHQARRWFVKINNGQVRAQDQIELEAWLASKPGNREAYSDLSRLWNDFGALDYALGSDPALAFRPALSRRSIRLPAFTLAGGGVFVVLCGLVLIAVSQGWLGLRTKSYSTEVAQISDVTLPDTSRLKLGAETKIEVASDKATRRANLKRGEAFFEVAKDPDRPFFVETDLATIRVVGTKFNVHVGPDDVTVDVAEGQVLVMRKPLSGTLEGGGEQQVQLKAGDGVQLARSGAFSATAHNHIDQALAWERGQLIFNNARLSTVISDMNRYSYKKFSIDDSVIGELRVTGLFHAGDFDGLSAAIQQTLPINVREITPNRYSLVSSKKTVE
jgi:transmembrane sensor